MSNQLEKLKQSIKKEYSKNFELSLMKTSGFIPVDKRQKDFWVILNQKNMENKSEIVSLLSNKFEGLSFQFIPVDSTNFEVLIQHISQTIEESLETVSEKSMDELSPEEMLVSIGWLTQKQLDECVTEANQKKLPLDALFHSKGYLSYEKIVSYLKKKY